MIKNYFKIAIRTLLKNKSTSFFNTLGLTVGITACLLILLFVHHELSYEKWNPNSDRILRVYPDVNFGSTLMKFAVSGAVIGPDVAKDMPEVQAFCRFRDYGDYLVKRTGDGQQNFREDNVLTVDSNFFQFFPTKVIVGNPFTCLSQPNQMAISESTAKKYFGLPQAAVGQTLILENEQNWNISAVYEDLPSTTHFDADLLLSMVENQEVAESPPYWASNNNFHTYIMLRPGVKLSDFAQKFKTYSKAKMEITAQALLGMSMAEFNASGQHARFELQEMKDIHLYSSLEHELQANGSIQYVWIFSAIAFFILLIACINYMNLTTARSAQRSREIGVRKVLGSERKTLMGQFLTESVLMTAVAMVIAISAAMLLLPWFRELTGREINLNLYQPGILLTLLGGTLGIALLAGAYPAFFLSGLNPMRMLRGSKGNRGGESSLRSALVVFQFMASSALIIGTILVYSQLKYIQNKNLGFNKEQVLVLQSAYGLGNNVNSFKEAMLQVPGVDQATVSAFLPVASARSNSTFNSSREFSIDNSVNMENWSVDYDYLTTLGLELTEGRFLDRNFPTDSSAIILNETAAKNFGFQEDPIGKNVYVISGPIQGAPQPEDFTELTVIGVVKDFHFASLRDNIGSLGLYLGNSAGNIAFRYQAAQSQEVLAALENNWRKMAPGQEFSYTFLDEAFSNMYESEQRIGTIALLFAALAIFVSCLGLLGLASFMAEQRTKEIGIRKVLGANIPGIVWMLSKDFLRLVLIALVVAAPLAYYFMEQWLQDFAYRIDITWWVFALAGGIALVLAFGTVSFQSIRAALTNPVESLRSE